MLDQAFPILCYHRIHANDDPSTPTVAPGAYCGHVTASQFERQMEYLAAGGYSTLTQDQIAAWLLDGDALPPQAVAIHFDDNRRNVFENGLPIMRARGFLATVFVVTDLADGKEVWKNDFPAMNWRDLKQILNAGWCIGGHTRSHVTFGGGTKPPRNHAHRLEEIAESQVILRKRLGISAGHFAYPGGTFDESAERVVKEFYRTARLWQEYRYGPPPACEYVTRQSDPYRLMGINISVKSSFAEFQEIVEGGARSGQAGTAEEAARSGHDRREALMATGAHPGACPGKST